MLPITPFPNGVPEDSHSPTKQLVKQLLLDGWTVTEIAHHLGVSKPTVCFHKRTLGIEIDTRFSRRYDWRQIRPYYDPRLLCPNCHSQTDNWGGKAKRARRVS